MTESVVKRSGQGAGSESEGVLVWFNRKAVPELTRQIVVGELDKDQIQSVIAHQNPFKISGWIRKRTKELEDYLTAFFGKTYNLTLFQETLQRYGKEQVEAWEELGLKVGFLPKEKMSQDAKFDGWKVKPKSWFYNQLKAGKIFRCSQDGELVQDDRADELEGIVVLFDTRQKPAYNGGRQMWEDDKEFLGGLIAKLRKQKELQKYEYGPQSSRFGVSADEWQEHLRLSTAGLLGLEVERVRLERAIEFNILSQIYSELPRAKDGETNTWLWFEEFFGDASGRLRGGDSDYGGLALVDWRYSAHQWRHLSFRPLAVLAP